MIVEWYIIALAIALLVAPAGGVAVFYRRKLNAQMRSHDVQKEDIPDFEDFLDKLNESDSYNENHRKELAKKIESLSLEMEKFTLKATELEEFVTRNMNKMSARYGRMKKMEEEDELRERLMQEAKELNNGHQQAEIFDPQSTNFRPRLRRRE